MDGLLEQRERALGVRAGWCTSEAESGAPGRLPPPGEGREAQKGGSGSSLASRITSGAAAISH
jgi:hypothetical protein